MRSSECGMGSRSRKTNQDDASNQQTVTQGVRETHMGSEGLGLWCDRLFKIRFVQGDFVEGGGDGAQSNRILNRRSHTQGPVSRA